MGEAPISIIGKARLFFLRCLSLDDDDEALKRSRTSSCVSHSSLSFREILSFFTRAAAEEVDAHNSHSRDTRFRARIANTRGDHFGQHKNKSFHSKDIRFRVHISNTRGAHL